MSPRRCDGEEGCGHVHGGRAFGICLEQVDGEPCPCVEVRQATVYELADRRPTAETASALAELAGRTPPELLLVRGGRR